MTPTPIPFLCHAMPCQARYTKDWKQRATNCQIFQDYITFPLFEIHICNFLNSNIHSQCSLQAISQCFWAWTSPLIAALLASWSVFICCSIWRLNPSHSRIYVSSSPMYCSQAGRGKASWASMPVGTRLGRWGCFRGVRQASSWECASCTFIWSAQGDPFWAHGHPRLLLPGTPSSQGMLE